MTILHKEADTGPPLEVEASTPADTGAEAECHSEGSAGQNDLAPSRRETKVSFFDGARVWAEMGFKVFPCQNRPGTDRHKSPHTRHGFKDATTDIIQIEKWGQEFPTALIGMPTGKATGIAVLDLDKKNGKDGFAAVPDWEELSPVTVRTGSGGAHVYFRADTPVRCSTGKNGADVRGDGGYVIVPPSTGYTWRGGNDLSSLPSFPANYRARKYIAQPAEELEAVDPAILVAALQVIPNNDEDYDRWNSMAMAVWSATRGTDEGFNAWDKWSQKSTKYVANTTARRWEGIHRSPPSSIGAGTVFFEANIADPEWRNRFFAVIDAKAEELQSQGLSDFCEHLGLNLPERVPGEAKALRTLGSSPDDGYHRPSTTVELATDTNKIEIEKASLGKRSSAERMTKSALGEWNAGSDDWKINARRWLLGNIYCRTFVSSLIADGGIGKTALRVAQALALATGRPLTGEKIFQRCRVLFVSLEDDKDELRRRVLAAMLHHNICLEEVTGYLFLSAPQGNAGKLVIADTRTRRPLVSIMKVEIEKAILAHKIDVLILDPLVKAHDVEENDNSAMDVVIQTLSNLAVAHNIAVDVLHHTSKGAADPGNADRGRGASAVKNGARLVYTLTQMNSDEAARFGIDEDKRRSYVRVDSGKVNITPPLERAQWFQIVGVPLGNAEELYPNGDNVQTVMPWTPPTAWDGISEEILERIIRDIDRGVPADLEKGIAEGGRYSDAPRVKTRAAWEVVARHSPAKNEKQCRDLIAELVKKKQLVVKDYHDPKDRKTVKGLYRAVPKDLENEPM